MKYLRLYNFIADAIRILAIQEEEVYKKYRALSVSKKKEINQKLAGLFPELYDKNLRYSEIKEDILSDDLMYRLGEFKEVCESKKEYFELIQLLENLNTIAFLQKSGKHRGMKKEEFKRDQECRDGQCKKLCLFTGELIL